MTKSAGRGESTTEGFFFCASNGARRHARRGRNASHVTEIPIADLICNAPRTASHTRLRVSPASRKGERRSASFTSGVIRFPRVSVTTFTSYSRSARVARRVSLDQKNDSNIFRLVANASRGGGHWHARGRSNRERPVFAPPSARPRAGHREAAERRVNPRPLGGGVTSSASAHFRLLARIGDPGDPPSRHWRSVLA